MCNTRKLRNQIDGIIAEAKSSVTYTTMIGGSHIKINLAFNGRKRLVVWPSTPSDHRSMKNAVALLKRTLRQMEGDSSETD